MRRITVSTCNVYLTMNFSLITISVAQTPLQHVVEHIAIGKYNSTRFYATKSTGEADTV